MICSKCDQEVEDGAAFCGNCGQQIAAKATPSVANKVTPEYAVAKPVQHSGEIKSTLSVVFGVIGIPGSLIPAVGFGLGVIGLVLGTLSRRSHHKIASTIGIIASWFPVRVLTKKYL